MQVLDKASLGTLDELGKGAMGRVYRVTASLDGGRPRPLAYKELTPKADPWNRYSIKESVKFRERLSPADRADLDSLAVWPLAVVHEKRRILGYVMELIDDGFYFRTPKAPVEANLSWLSAKESNFKRSGVDPKPFAALPVRAYLLAQLAYSISWLHRRGRIYGDLSLKNGLFATQPIRFKLMDCDATAAPGDAKRRQANTPGFHPPEFAHTHLQTMATDVYKLALCIIRGLSTGRGATQIRTTDHLVGTLSSDVIALLNRALGDDPRGRPTAKELWEGLTHFLDTSFPPPQFEQLAVTPTAVLRGLDVMVDWLCYGASTVTVTGPDGAEQTHDAAKGRCAVRVDTSGEIRITAANAYGYMEAKAGDVQVWEVPNVKVDPIDYPHLKLPEIPRPGLRIPGPGRPVLPRVRVGDVQPQGETVGELHAAVGGLARGVQDLVRSASASTHRRESSIRDGMQTELSEAARILREKALASAAELREGYVEHRRGTPDPAGDGATTKGDQHA